MVDKTECSIDGTDVWQTDDDDDVITEPVKSLLLSSFIPNTKKIHEFTQKHTNQLHNTKSGLCHESKNPINPNYNPYNYNSDFDKRNPIGRNPFKN